MKTWIPDARNFAYLNWKQVDALPRESTLLILPTAAIEQHGHHLPLATDTLINNLLLDPEVPVLAPGGPAAPNGQFDQSALELGNNLLVYTTSPLDAPVRVFGTPRISLFCATSAAHTDFVAKLVRVRPTGAAEFVCIGIARSSWLFAQSGYAADNIHHWEFDLEPTSCLFAHGDRIRLEIASSAFPLYDRNPGTAVQSCRAPAQKLFKLRLPNAIPSLFVGIRIASGISVIGAITGELYAGSSQVGVGGLGYSILYASSQLQTDYLFALVFAATVLGFAFFFVVMFLEWYFLHRWHESARTLETE